MFGCTLALLFACLQMLSAQKLPSTLLWRISGNGFQKPSYLFGTLHLTDERIFNLGDSVYHAIEKADGFAMEIDPEQFTPFVIDEARKKAMETIRLKDMMQKDEYKKYGKILAKKLGKNADEITTADILHEKNKWIQESYSTGKMQSFLDVYLFDIARRQGKWTGGVEDLEDQENLFDLVDKSDIQDVAMSDDAQNAAATKSMTAFLIKTYIDNNLNAIDSFSNAGDSTFKDALLVKRNKKMALRMDSLGKERSMVFAVGAAHLPGEEGLIALLKEKGFTVEPVFSSRKIKAADYKVAEVEQPWYDIKDESGYYTVQMPGKAGNLNLYAILNMKMYFDVFKSTIYMTTALQTPYTQKMADSVFNGVISYYFNTNKYSDGKPITINNIPGREFVSSKNNYSHGYFLFKDGMMYMAIAVSMKKDTSGVAFINKFLHSFTIHTASDGNEEFGYVNNMKAYKLNVPGTPKSGGEMLDSDKDTSVNMDLNISTDPVSGSYYFFGTNDAASGFYITNDSVTLSNIRASQRSRFTTLTVDSMYFKNGHRALEIGGKMKDAQLTLDAHYEFRGNRWYVLVAMYDSAKGKAAAQKFMNSFQPINYINGNWKTNVSDDGLFSTWSPENFRYIMNPDDGDTTFSYESYDSSRADSYSIYIQHFNNYYWQESDSAFWQNIIENYKDLQDGDSALYIKPISNDKVSGYEFAFRSPGSHNIKRLRKLLNDGKIYSLVTIQDSAEINNANTNKFFESFRFNKVLPSDGLFISKAGVLLNDLVSEDSATKASAANYLDEAPFTKNDLPLLHQAVLKTYIDKDEEDDYDVAREDIRRIITRLKDSSSYLFAKTHYNEADDETKNVLLDIMVTFETAAHFDEIKTLLLQNPPHITPSYTFTNILLDTLQLTAPIFKDLQPLIKDTAMAPVIVRVANKLLDSSLVDKSFLENYRQDILKFATQQYLLAQSDEDSYSAANYALINLLGKMNNVESNAILQQWSLLNNNYLQLSALEKLLENNQPVDSKAVKALAADKSQRTDLYDALKSYKKEKLFPAHYLSQKSFAESLVYVASSDDEYPDTMVYLSNKVLKFQGKQARFYFYKVGFGEDGDTTDYLACAGPFNVNEKDATVKNAEADVYYDDEYDEDTKDELTEALITQMEDWYEAEEK